MQRYLDAIRDAELVRRTGRVSQLSGLGIEAVGPDALVGEVCEISPRAGGASGEAAPGQLHLRADVRDGHERG